MMATHRFGALGSPTRIPTVMTAGFRFFFLSAGIFSVFAMLAWTVWLGVHAAGGTFISTPMAMHRTSGTRMKWFSATRLPLLRGSS